LSITNDHTPIDYQKELVSLAILARFIRAHPDTPWPELVSTGLGGGYTLAEIQLADCCVGVELINRSEEEALSVLAQRN